MKQVGFGIVIAALLVSAPRLTLAFLLGDGVHVADRIEIAILTATGIGSGIVLTIGNAVLAHALAIKAHQRGVLWWLEATAWVLFLIGAPILVAPTLVAGLQRSTLASVLQTPQAAWTWAITAVVIVELLVGAAMTATILASEQHATPVQATGKPSFWFRVGEVLLTKLEQSVIEPSESSLPPMTAAHPPALTDAPSQTKLDAANRTRKRQKEQAKDAALALYDQQPDATLSDIAQQVGRSKSTVSTYLQEGKHEEQEASHHQSKERANQDPLLVSGA